MYKVEIQHKSNARLYVYVVSRSLFHQMTIKRKTVSMCPNNYFDILSIIPILIYHLLVTFSTLVLHNDADTNYPIFYYKDHIILVFLV